MEATFTLLERNALSFFDLERAWSSSAVVPVVPQSLSCTAVTAGTGPAICSYDMNAAFMSSQPHESGIHAVRRGAGEGSVTDVRFHGPPNTH
jgi:hypothetical protein